MARWIAPVLVLLALAALLVGVARPQVDGLVPQDRATVVLVLDVSRLDGGARRQAEPHRRREAGDPALPRPRARPAEGRHGRLRRRAAGRVAADDRPRAGQRVARQPRRLRDVRRDGDRRRAQHGRRRRARLAASRTATPRRSRRGAARTANKLVSILFLSDGAQTRGRAPAARGRAAREGGGDARLHRRARDAERHRPGRRRRLLPVRAGAHPRAARHADAARDRRDDRRRVHGGARRRDGRQRVREARLEPRAQKADKEVTYVFLGRGGRAARRRPALCRRSGRPACPRLSPA